MFTWGIWLYILLLMGLWGGFYEFAAALYSASFLVSILLLGHKTGKIQIPCNVTTYGLGILGVCSVLSSFLARDRGTAFLGSFKILAAVLFWILWNNIPQKEREQIWKGVPAAASIVTVVALAAYVIPGVRESFFRAGRLGGTFQYSNTYGMLLLGSVIILLFNEERSRWVKAELVILLAGIVFTGSRSVFVIAIIVLGTFILHNFSQNTPQKKSVLWILTGLTMIGATIMGGYFMGLDVGRLGKLTLTSSTLNGRFLYWKDALHVVLRRPLGLGYMGYFYLQPQFQTGYYITRFVHNDVLQCALDMGVPAMLALLAVVFANIVSKKNTKRQRFLLFILFLHGLFDFDFQFAAMSCIALMCMDTQAKRCWTFNLGRAAMGAEMAVIGVCVYFSIALGLAYGGADELALRLYPYNTSARMNLAEKEGKREDAQRVIKENGMLAGAYELALEDMVGDGEYRHISSYVKQMTECAGYEIYYYDQGVFFLSHALDQAVRAGDREAASEILGELKQIPERLEKLRRRTSGLAYRIADKPSFELRSDIEDYLEKISNISI